MAKKQKFAPEGEVQAPQGQVEAQGDAQAAALQGEKTPAIPRGFHLVADTEDIHGRTKYRFGKYSQMPKKAPRIHVMVDGEETEMAVTNSGGYAVEKGYNGYLAARGFIGWILFGHGVDPQSVEQFPNGLNFTTEDGTCEANPLREPANPENEAKRRQAAKDAAVKRAADKAAAAPAETATEGEHQTA
jgi:hypothetical protein